MSLLKTANLVHLLKMYAGNHAAIAHSFLLKVCTQPGIGLCFRNDGWYPPKQEDPNRSIAMTGDDEERHHHHHHHHHHDSSIALQGKYYNRPLWNLLVQLRPLEDVLQKELYLKALVAAPELVHLHWKATGGSTFEPQTTSYWLCRMNWAVQLQSLAVPDFAPSESMTNPPSLDIFMDNILPSPLTRAILVKGLLHRNLFVRHITVIVVIAAFEKLNAVLQQIQSQIFDTYQDRTVLDTWSQTKLAILEEMRRRVPEVQVILALHNSIVHSENIPAVADGDTKEKDADGDEAMSTTEEDEFQQFDNRRLVLAGALCLVKNYILFLPELVNESRFDFGKLFHGLFTGEDSTMEGVPVGSSEEEAEDQVLLQEHVLDIVHLKASEFKWSNPSVLSGRSHLGNLLHLACTAPHERIRTRLREKVLPALLETMFSFQYTPYEIRIWLEELVAMEDGVDRTIAFLERCCLDASKVTWKMVDELQSFFQHYHNNNNSINKETIDQTYRYHMTMVRSPSHRTLPSFYHEKVSAAFGEIHPSYPFSTFLLPALKQWKYMLEKGGAAGGDVQAVTVYLKRVLVRIYVGSQTSVDVLPCFLEWYSKHVAVVVGTSSSEVFQKSVAEVKALMGSLAQMQVQMPMKAASPASARSWPTLLRKSSPGSMFRETLQLLNNAPPSTKDLFEIAMFVLLRLEVVTSKEHEVEHVEALSKCIQLLGNHQDDADAMVARFAIANHPYVESAVRSHQKIAIFSILEQLVSPLDFSRSRQILSGYIARTSDWWAAASDEDLASDEAVERSLRIFLPIMEAVEITKCVNMLLDSIQSCSPRILHRLLFDGSIRNESKYSISTVTLGIMVEQLQSGRFEFVPHFGRSLEFVLTSNADSMDELLSFLKAVDVLRILNGVDSERLLESLPPLIPIFLGQTALFYEKERFIGLLQRSVDELRQGKIAELVQILRPLLTSLQPIFLDEDPLKRVIAQLTVMLLNCMITNVDWDASILNLIRLALPYLHDTTLMTDTVKALLAARTDNEQKLLELAWLLYEASPQESLLSDLITSSLKCMALWVNAQGPIGAECSHLFSQIGKIPCNEWLLTERNHRVQLVQGSGQGDFDIVTKRILKCFQGVPSQLPQSSSSGSGDDGRLPLGVTSFVRAVPSSTAATIIPFGDAL